MLGPKVELDRKNTTGSSRDRDEIFNNNKIIGTKHFHYTARQSDLLKIDRFETESREWVLPFCAHQSVSVT